MQYIVNIHYIRQIHYLRHAVDSEYSLYMACRSNRANTLELIELHNQHFWIMV
jgi:hypothetical protein